MDTGPRIDSYEWSGGREAMLRFGSDDGPVAVLALPLFEEANRTRAFGVSLLRALAARGIGGVLPELPGQGESETGTADVRLADLRTAFAAAPGTHSLAIRSGALLLDERPGWALAPQEGSALLHELGRAKGDALDGEVVEIAGNFLSRALLDGLGPIHPGEGRGPVEVEIERQPATPAARQLGRGLRRGGCRTVRLASDPGEADFHVDGPALWRRAEPDNDPVLVEQLAADIADWIAPCGG